MGCEKSFLVEVSARHVHLKEADIEVLFGTGAQLTVKRTLLAPTDFLCNERVDLIGPKSAIKNVAILGPTRKATQVEVSVTDCYALGVDRCVRHSGDTAGSAAVKIRGPAGELALEEGCIVAARHIHMKPEHAAEYGVVDGELVDVVVETDRPVIFQDTKVRVSPNFVFSMHIDTDEANAALIPREGTQGRLLKK